MPRFRTPPETPPTQNTRTLAIPNSREWLAVFSDALAETINPYNYTQKDSESLTPEAAALIAYEAYEAWLQADEATGGGDCPDCVIPDSDPAAPFTRLNPNTGRPERLGTGEQFGLWIPFWADENWPESGDNYPTVAPTHEESLDPICAAAANAVNAIKTLLNGVFDLYADEVEPAIASSETAILIGATIGATFYPPARAIIAAAEFGFAVFYDVMGHLTENYWTEAFEDNLTCLLKDNATLNEDGTVTFAFTVVLWEMLSTLWTAQAYVLLVAQVQYLLTIIGRDGLDAAGALDAVSGDCSACGTWTMKFEKGTAVPLTMWTLAKGSWAANGAAKLVSGAPPELYAEWGFSQSVQMSLTVDTSQCTITKIDFGAYGPLSYQSYHAWRRVDTSLGVPEWAEYTAYPYFTAVNYGGRGLLTDTTTTDSTRVLFTIGRYGQTDSGVDYIRLYGTGTNPFGADN